MVKENQITSKKQNKENIIYIPLNKFIYRFVFVVVFFLMIFVFCGMVLWYISDMRYELDTIKLRVRSNTYQTQAVYYMIKDTARYINKHDWILDKIKKNNLKEIPMGGNYSDSNDDSYIGIKK